MTAQAHEAQPLTQRASVKNAAVDIRNDFVRKVYGILSAQLVVTVAVAAPFQLAPIAWLSNNFWVLYVSTALTLVTMCTMVCCEKTLRSYPTNYFVLFTFTLFEGVSIGFVSAFYTWQSVLLAAGITVGVFILLTIYAWNTTEDFTGLGPYLFGACACLFLFGFVISILAACGVAVQAMTIVYDVLGVLLFVFYIIYDTQLILGSHGGHKQQFGIDDYCFAALNLYMDIIQMFLYILSLLGERK